MKLGLYILSRLRKSMVAPKRRNLAEAMLDPPESASVLVGPPLPRGLVSKSKTERFTFSLSEMPSLIIGTGLPCDVRVTGANTAEYSVDLNADAMATTEKEADTDLDRTTLAVEHGMLVVRTPPPTSWQPGLSLRVSAPKERPVMITSPRSIIEVSCIAERVTLAGSGGLVRLADISGELLCMLGGQGGMILYTGHRGWARLEAGEIHIALTAPAFDGNMDAVARGDLRVSLPPEFRSPFVAEGRQVIVTHDGLRSLVTREQAEKRELVTYGSDPRVMHLLSERATVTIEGRGTSAPARP